MTPSEFNARLEATGAGKKDVAYIAGVSVRAVRMATSEKGWKGNPARLLESSPIRQALDAIEKGKRAPPSVSYKSLDKIYGKRKW